MTMRSALQLDLFGLDGFAPIQGLLLIFAMVGGMAAPPLVGWMFDSSHTYHAAWIGLTVVTLFALPLVLLASKPVNSISKKAKST
jgi:cyanate permease